ncbi:MAG: hypothetical protein JWN40_379 [Phycisphaerales bacterium]|nr:hypothetical protein [Phycisphaerales bacterium]
MGRVELLFGELASEIGKAKVSRHAPPDARLPLRMQCRGNPTPGRRRTEWRASLWARALASRAGRRRASAMGLVAMIVGVLLQNPLWRIAVLGGLTAAVALVAGAWTEVAMLGEVLERGRN